PDVIWHGVEPFAPDFSHMSRTVAFCLDGAQTGREIDRDFYIACNAWIDAIGFRIPAAPGGRPWRRAIDTAQLSPLATGGPNEGPVVPTGEVYPVAAHSMIVLIAEC